MESWSETLGATHAWMKQTEVGDELLRSYGDQFLTLEEVIESNNANVSTQNLCTLHSFEFVLLMNFIPLKRVGHG